MQEYILPIINGSKINLSDVYDELSVKPGDRFVIKCESYVGFAPFTLFPLPQTLTCDFCETEDKELIDLDSGPAKGYRICRDCINDVLYGSHSLSGYLVREIDQNGIIDLSPFLFNPKVRNPTVNRHVALYLDDDGIFVDRAPECALCGQHLDCGDLCNKCQNNILKSMGTQR